LSRLWGLSGPVVPPRAADLIKDSIFESSSNFGKQIENWQGLDVNVSARLRNGLMVQGGTSTWRRLADSCAIRSVLPELGPKRPLRRRTDSLNTTGHECRELAHA
jgi:hypothetical protein